MTKKKEECNEGVRIKHAALDDENGDLILRGVINPHDLHRLLADDYQREVNPLAKIMDLVEAFQTGSVPDIDLGMRGHRCEGAGEAYCLLDDIYIIDGLQRVTAAMHLMQQNRENLPKLGATIHFGTSKEWERNRFRILNADRTKLSSNILLRNLKDELPVMKMLTKLTEQKGFVMKDRICWNQRMKRGELMTAVTFVRIVGALNSHLGPGLYTNWHEIANGLQKIANNIGMNVLRSNIKTFFDLIDNCWGIGRIVYRDGATHIKFGFLLTLARVIASHRNFWKGENDQRLFIEAQLMRKISLFPIDDPQIVSLSNGGKMQDLLFLLMVRHINKGKTTKRLIPRNATEIPDENELFDDQDDSEEENEN